MSSYSDKLYAPYTSASPLPPLENPPTIVYTPFDRTQLTFSSSFTFLDQTISVAVDPTPILYWDNEPSSVHVTNVFESAKSL